MDRCNDRISPTPMIAWPKRLLRTAAHAAIMATALAAPLAAAEEVYQWIDSEGIVNYGKQPPEGVQATLIRTNVAGGTRVVETRTTGEPKGPKLTPEQQSMLDNLKRKEADRQVEVARIRAANCTKARDVLSRLTQVGRIKVRGEDGEYSVLPEDERRRQIEQAQEGIAVNCDPTESA